MQTFAMEVRSLDASTRTLVGVAVPYGETTLLTSDPAGERFVPGAFARSIAHRGSKVPLLANHETERVMGYSTSFDDGDDALVGTFRVNDGDQGDALLADLRNGYYSGLSVGFVPLRSRRADDGVREHTEAKLVEVSTVGVPAYEGAGLLAVRSAQSLDDLLAPFLARPDVNLQPIPSPWH
jgi:hypothetical protein